MRDECRTPTSIDFQFTYTVNLLYNSCHLLKNKTLFVSLLFFFHLFREGVVPSGRYTGIQIERIGCINVKGEAVQAVSIGNLNE